MENKVYKQVDTYGIRRSIEGIRDVSRDMYQFASLVFAKDVVEKLREIKQKRILENRLYSWEKK